MLSNFRTSRLIPVALLFVAASSSQQAEAYAPHPGDLTFVGRPPAETVTVSQVRIVRLSQVSGRVLLDRGTEHGFEQAFSNLPVVQGSRLQTLEGLAEVEFEDNSSLRIAPSSQVDFSQLGRAATGATTNRVLLQKGTLYLSLTKTKGNNFEVAVGNKIISVPPAGHIRLDAYPDGTELAVLHGKVQVTDSNSQSTWTVGTDKAFKFGSVASDQPVFLADDRPGLYDQWDKTQADYHNNRVGSAFSGTPYQYGLNDLNYYGSFNSVAGCGQVWQPYFASASWDPFSTGVWAWYPGTGYSWVSPYPWGWTPFHSGSWISCPNGAGWGWRPGNNWTGVNNVLALHPTRGPRPPLKPVVGRSGLVVVGSSLARPSHITASQKFEFTKDSAGLGVPRNLPVKLQKMSGEVSVRGTIQAPVRGIESVAVASAGSRSMTGITNAGQRGLATGSGNAATSMINQHATSRPLAPTAAATSSGGGGGYTASRGPVMSPSSTVSMPASRPPSPSPTVGQGGGKAH